jgi:hypothetical protein
LWDQPFGIAVFGLEYELFLFLIIDPDDFGSQSSGSQVLIAFDPIESDDNIEVCLFGVDFVYPEPDIV